MILGVQVTENRILSKARTEDRGIRPALPGGAGKEKRRLGSRSVMGPNKKLENESGA